MEQLLLHSQICDEFRALRIGHDQVVTDGAVIGDACAAFRIVAAVVAAEAARGIVVSNIVGMGTPGDLHRGKDICVINADESFRG